MEESVAVKCGMAKPFPPGVSMSLVQLAPCSAVPSDLISPQEEAFPT